MSYKWLINYTHSIVALDDLFVIWGVHVYSSLWQEVEMERKGMMQVVLIMYLVHKTKRRILKGKIFTTLFVVCASILLGFCVWTFNKNQYTDFENILYFISKEYSLTYEVHAGGNMSVKLSTFTLIFHFYKTMLLILSIVAFF